MKQAPIKLIQFVLCAALVISLLAGCTKEKQAAGQDIPLDTIMENIRSAYGEAYIPNSEIPAELLESIYGLTPELYADIRSEMAMISTFPDTVILVKAAEGKGDDVEAALRKARDTAVSNTLQYPMNIAKTNASQVVRQGDYIVFLLVGANGEFQDAQSAEAAKFAQDETKKGVDAFNDSFK